MAPGSSLLDRLGAHLEKAHHLSLVPMGRAQMKGGHAELNTTARTIKYDASLSDGERLMRFAHELGHLVLHQRLRDGDSHSDPLTASVYGAAGPSAIARYSPRTYEETQAEAFALELVAPADAVWTMWREHEGVSAAALAAHFGCGTDIIHTQLAHALYTAALGGSVPSASRKDVPFTPAQLAAARFTGAPAIVDAGPGTGKTATVIERIRYLCEERGARPNEILALTFSNEAAQELSERVAAAFGDDVADALNVRTFHGFGVEFLHLHGHHVGLGQKLELLDDDRQVELVSALLGRVPCDQIINLRDPNETAARVVEHINYCKQRLHDVDTLDALDATMAARQFVELFRAYEAEKWGKGRAQPAAEGKGRAQARAEYIDFADLIALPIRILERHADVRAGYATRFPWVIVDEFQDVTRATSRLLRALCGDHNPPWVVGDARQSIYQFLGAAPENVTTFAKDFENAHVFALDVNYRSSEPVVAAANQLATLLEDGAATADARRARWTAGTDAAPLGANPVSVAEAATDAAEANGVASRVREWIEGDGVVPGDIAVLCRRHVDVRNVILELSRRGIKAQASGVLTAEGVAGDLAAMVTLADAPAASVPRVAFALGRGRYDTDEINTTIGELLRELRSDAAATNGGDVLGTQVKRLYERLNCERDRGDGFATLATALFDDGAHLRRILAMPDSAERQMALVEVVSVLSLATAYRATHRGVPPRLARLGFAERLRERLTRTLPVPLSPRPRTDAVHVMTCHASKGLEFPCVIVVGQTLPGIDDGFDWLPASIRPDSSREMAQANALLFVGVTRAKRSVLVSFPRRASAGTRGAGKKVVPLLQQWREAFGVPTVEWAAESPPDVRVAAGNVWGVPLPREVKASALGDSVCPLKTYVETYADARFPLAARELYPSFFNDVRRSLRAVVAWAHETGSAASDDDAYEIFQAQWPAEKHGEHPHAELYRRVAVEMVREFGRAFRPMACEGVLELETELVVPSGDGLDVRLDLIARYRRNDGVAVVIAFRPESLARGEVRLNWSDLGKGQQGVFALLEHARPGARPYVYSGRDGRIYEYLWSKSKKSLPTLTAALEERRAAFARGEFGVEVSRYQCDRCVVRAGCPAWMAAGAMLAGSGSSRGAT